MSIRPIFIGGCGRSGTTLLGSMLGAASQAVVTPESQFLWEVMEGNAPTQGENFMPLFLEHWRLKIWGLDHAALSNVKATYEESVELLIKQYAQKNGVDQPNVWIDHTPASIAYVSFLLSHFPDAKFIHLVRDGRAVASSVLKLNWGPADMIEAAIWWRSTLCYGLAAEALLGEDRVLRVKYEDLLSDSERELNKICSFADIPYSQTMLEGGAFSVPSYTQSQHSKVGGGIKQSQINAWRKNLSQRDVELFENRTAQLLESLGYEMDYGVAATRATRAENIRYEFGFIFRIYTYFVQKMRRFKYLRQNRK